MAEYIDKDDLKFLAIPIAPVLQGEQVHYEQGFLKEWLESVPTANVIERSKIDKALEQTYEVRDMVLHSNRMYEPNDVLEIIDEITACFERSIGE